MYTYMYSYIYVCVVMGRYRFPRGRLLMYDNIEIRFIHCAKRYRKRVTIYIYIYIYIYIHIYAYILSARDL